MTNISLIVPVYNMETFLPRCIKTLLAQTATNFEVVLVDDGSTDRSPELCDQCAEAYPDIIRVIHKPNGGLSSARNAGIDAAKGKFISFPDPDDWVEINYVSSFLQLYDAHKADLICTGYYVDFDDKSIPALCNQNPILFDVGTAKASLLRPNRMSGFAWNKLYLLDIIQKNHLRFLDDVGTTEDLDFTFRYLDYCRTVYFAPTIRTYHYYQRDGAATRSGFSLHKLNRLRTYEKIISTSNRNNEIIRLAKGCICVSAVNLLLLYTNSTFTDPTIPQKLRCSIRDTLFTHLRSPDYGFKQKIQSILAYCNPWIYTQLKKICAKPKKFNRD